MPFGQNRMQSTLFPAENAPSGHRVAYRGAPTSQTLSRPSGKDAVGRLAAALASGDDAGARLETRLVSVTVATRTIIVTFGVLFGLLRPNGHKNFWIVALVMIGWAAFESYQQLHSPSIRRVQVLTIIELVLSVTAIMFSGGFKSPFVLAPVTGLLLAGYVWGRRATVGTAVAGAIAATAAIAIQSADVADQRAASQVAVIFMLCGALGAFTRTLVAEIEVQRAAAIDQATQMATANDLLVSLHALAQTLPASFDLGEVVESIRLRLELHRR